MAVDGRDSAVGKMPFQSHLACPQHTEKIKSGSYLCSAGSCDPQDVILLPLWEDGGEEQDQHFFGNSPWELVHFPGQPETQHGYRDLQFWTKQSKWLSSCQRKHLKAEEECQKPTPQESHISWKSQMFKTKKPLSQTGNRASLHVFHYSSLPRYLMRSWLF